MNKKKILIVLTRFPYPPVDGTRITILYNVISGLSKKYSVSICIVTLETPEPGQVKYLEDNFGPVKVFHIPKLMFYFNSLFSFFTRYPMQTYGHFSPEAAEWFDSELKNFDAVFVQTIRLGKYFENMDKVTRQKVSLHFQDAFSLNYLLGKKMAPIYWRIIYHLELKKVQKYETDMLNCFSWLTIVSERDKNHILANLKVKKNKDFRFTQIPFGVRDSLVALPKSKEKTGLVFIGNLKYPPNYDGVKYFCENTWGKLRERFPGLKCTIIGNGRELFKKKYDGIEFPGFVDDPFPLLCDSKIFISPVRFGAGMVTKVVEAMALDLPVVTTPVCANGISGVEHNKNILISEVEDTDAWVENISRLLTDPQFCTSVSDNALKLVKENYLNSIVEQRWIDYFDEITSSE